MSSRGPRDVLGRVFGLAFAALLLASCGSSSRPSAAGLPAPTVEYSGCWSVNLPHPLFPECTLYPPSMEPIPHLVLWVKAEPGTDVEIRADRRRLQVAGLESGGGRSYHMPFSHQVSLLTVRLCRPDGRCGPSWALHLARPEEEPAWYSDLRRQALGKERLRQRLLQIQKGAPGKKQGFILRMLAELDLVEGKNGDAEGHLKRGISADRVEHCWSCEEYKRTRLAGLYKDQGRFSEARQTLAELPNLPEAPADSKYRVAYYQGLLADRVGDYRSALDRLQTAADLAERAGMIRYRLEDEEVIARLLQDLGRSQEASERFKQLKSELLNVLREDTDPEAPCEIGTLLTNMAWSRLVAREGGDEAPGDPTPTLELVRTLYDRSECASPAKRLNARLNLALAYQQAGRWADARLALNEALALAAPQPTLLDQLWLLDLEGRAAIAEGQPELALKLYRDLEALAEQTASLDGRFRAALGRAQALRACGGRAEAIDSLAEADHLIDDQILQIPVHEGRDTFLAQREAATRLHLQLLLEAGKAEGAFLLARQDRSRLLRQLLVKDRLAQLSPEERQEWVRVLSQYRILRQETDRQAAGEWSLSGDELKGDQQKLLSQLARAKEKLDRAVAGLGKLGNAREVSFAPPRPGEVILAYHPLPPAPVPGGLARNQWVGFAAYTGKILFKRFELPSAADPPTLARLLLEPFHAEIARAERIRVLPYGERLWSVDFHALPFDAEPLLARHLVVYSLDLPTNPSPAPAGRHAALVVGDPLGDLWAAREEAKHVATVIDSWRSGWSLKQLESTDANAGAVRKALPGADFFHYAGHGIFEGYGGWDSGLKLADGSLLSLGDVLALPRVPTWIVLSTCEAGRSSKQAPGEGLGLANAFLLAGAQDVVAAPQPVDDRIARDMVVELYKNWRPGADLPFQLRRAQLASRQKHPSAWASFRLLEP
jgi:tetratricopeptide (TPR) repeat protein